MRFWVCGSLCFCGVIWLLLGVEGEHGAAQHLLVLVVQAAALVHEHVVLGGLSVDEDGVALLLHRGCALGGLEGVDVYVTVLLVIVLVLIIAHNSLDDENCKTNHGKLEHY